jgi:hypothetical protein
MLQWAMLDSNKSLKHREIGELAVSRSINVTILEDSPPIDADLRSIIEAWPNLPDTVKADIVRVIRSGVA